jgi:predicted DNA-binding transcriptional regulator AlpA
MQFISRKQLAARRGVSLSTQKRIEKDPRHPRAVRLSPGRIGWDEDETIQYDQMLLAERRVQVNQAA